MRVRAGHVHAVRRNTDHHLEEHMSARIDALLDAAAAAVANLKATTVANKEENVAAFVASAVATHELVKASKGGASRLAERNKEARVGYTSPAAVGFHAMTGAILSKPEGEIDPESPFPSPTGIQTLVKKVGQTTAAEIVKKHRTMADAVYALQAAVPNPEVAALIKAARAQVEKAVAAFDLRGTDLTDEESAEVRDLLSTIDNLIAPATAVIIPGVPDDASSLTEEVTV